MNTPPRPSWRIVPFLMVLVFLGHFNRIAITVAGSERLIPENGIAPTTMGLVYSAFLLPYIFGMIPAGVLADRVGPWLVLTIALFGLAAGSAATGIVGGMATASALVATLFVVRGVMGFLSSPLHPSTSRIVSNWFPLERRTAANGFVLSAAMLGTALTFYLFGGLMDRLPWPTAFLVLGGITATFGLLWFLFAGDTPTARRAPPTKSDQSTAFWTLLFNRNLLLLTVAYFAVCYFEYLFFYWIQYYFGTVRNLGNDTSRLYSTIVTLAMGVGVLSGGWITDRFVRLWGRDRGRATVPVVGMVFGAACLVIGMQAETPLVVLAWLSLGALTVTASEASCWATAIELGGAHGAAAGGIMNFGGNIGGLIAPILTPWVGTQLGWSWAGGVGAGLSLAGGLLWLKIQQQSEPT